MASRHPPHPSHKRKRPRGLWLTASTRAASSVASPSPSPIPGVFVRPAKSAPAALMSVSRPDTAVGRAAEDGKSSGRLLFTPNPIPLKRQRLSEEGRHDNPPEDAMMDIESSPMAPQSSGRRAGVVDSPLATARPITQGGPFTFSDWMALKAAFAEAIYVYDSELSH
jgi:hypothetical protein